MVDLFDDVFDFCYGGFVAGSLFDDYLDFGSVEVSGFVGVEFLEFLLEFFDFAFVEVFGVARGGGHFFFPCFFLFGVALSLVYLDKNKNWDYLRCYFIMFFFYVTFNSR